jgi:hypothetical protein
MAYESVWYRLRRTFDIACTGHLRLLVSAFEQIIHRQTRLDFAN